MMWLSDISFYSAAATSQPIVFLSHFLSSVSGCTPVMEENPPSPLKLYEKDAEGKLMPPSLDSEDPVTAAPDQMEKEQTDAEILHVMEEIRPADEMTDFGRIEELEQFAKVQEVQEDEQPPPLEEIIQAEVSNHVESIPVRREDESISNVPPPQSVSRGKENNHVSHTEKEKEAEQKGSGILAKALLTLALLVCAIVIFIVVLFETKVDFLDPVRKAHQVKMVESLYYRPSRDYAIHQANHLYSDVLQPSAKYVHSQWHKIVTKKAASPK